MSEVEKRKAIDSAMSQIEKQFGKGSIMQMDEKNIQKIPVVSTGNIVIDKALGIGGFPLGRIVEVYGPESSGKTTLALHVIAEAQKQGQTVAFIDAEHALDTQYASNLGVKVNDLLLSQPDYGEQALEITDILVRSGGVNVIVVDSVAALVPKNEITGEMGDQHMGLQARLMSHALRKLTASVAKTNCLIIFINQLRQKIGVFFGNPEVTTGGVALKFYSSLRLEIRRISSLKIGDSIIGNRAKIKVVKNKLAPPFHEVEFDIIFGEGISNIGSLIDFAVDKNIIQKSGSWFSFGESKIGQGKENVKQYLKDNPEVLVKIEQKIKEENQDNKKGIEKTNGKSSEKNNGKPSEKTNGTQTV